MNEFFLDLVKSLYVLLSERIYSNHILIIYLNYREDLIEE